MDTLKQLPVLPVQRLRQHVQSTAFTQLIVDEVLHSRFFMVLFRSNQKPKSRPILGPFQISSGAKLTNRIPFLQPINVSNMDIFCLIGTLVRNGRSNGTDGLSGESSTFWSVNLFCASLFCSGAQI